MKEDLNVYSSIAEEAVAKASEILLNSFELPQQISKKNDDTFVTETDIKSEKAIIKILKQHTPDFGIYAEEKTLGGLERKEYTWIIDPLDGTDNFYLNFPHFAVSIALEHKGEIIAGVTSLLTENITLIATKGGGCYANKKQVYSSKRTLEEGLVLVDTYWDNKDCEIINLFSQKSRNLSILNSACTSIAYVAMGRADVFIDRVDKAWDIAAGSLFVREAGGIVTNPSGGTFDVYNPKCVASNGVSHEQSISLLSTLTI